MARRNPCKKGEIDIDRKGYTRKAYTRKDGTRVKASRVPASSFCVEDPGRPGRRARGAEKGPYRKDPKWIQDTGSLGGPGYTKKAAKSRHRILDACVRKEDYRSCLGKITVLLRNSELKASTRKKLEADKNYLKKKYGGPGSFGPRNKKRRRRRRNAPQDWTPIGVIGDMSPIEHWGGIVYETPYGHEMIYFQESEGTVWAHRVDINDDAWSWLDWVDWDDVSSYTGASVADLEAAAKSRDPIARAQVYEAVAGYYGWGEFDDQPETLTLEEAEEKYEDDVDQAHAYKKKNPRRRKKLVKKRGRRNPIKDMPGGSVAGCIAVQKKKPKGKRPRDPGAYCAAIADKIEPGWREKQRNPESRLQRLARRMANGG